MGKRLNWQRAKPLRGTETKFEDGTVLPTGEIVSKSLDSMARRARDAETRWLQKNGMRSLADNPKKSRKKKKPKRPDRRDHRPEPPPFDDVVMETLDQMETEKSHG